MVGIKIFKEKLADILADGVFSKIPTPEGPALGLLPPEGD
jgi:hypothetical protein